MPHQVEKINVYSDIKYQRPSSKLQNASEFYVRQTDRVFWRLISLNPPVADKQGRRRGSEEEASWGKE